MRRRLFNLAAAVSVILLLATTILWLRSIWVDDAVDVGAGKTRILLWSTGGQIQLALYSFDPPRRWPNTYHAYRHGEPSEWPLLPRRGPFGEARWLGFALGTMREPSSAMRILLNLPHAFAAGVFAIVPGAALLIAGALAGGSDWGSAHPAATTSAPRPTAARSADFGELSRAGRQRSRKPSRNPRKDRSGEALLPDSFDRTGGTTVASIVAANGSEEDQSMGAKRTGGMTAVALLNFIVGPLLITHGLMTLYGAYNAGIDSWFSEWKLMCFVAFALLLCAIGAFGIVGGVGLLRVARWARLVCYIYAGALLVIVLVCFLFALRGPNDLNWVGAVIWLGYAAILMLLCSKSSWRRAFAGESTPPPAEGAAA